MSKLFWFALACLGGRVLADDCRMSGGQLTQPYHEDNPRLCLPQGEGVWTFAMSTQALWVPSPNDGDGPPPTTGLVTPTNFEIADNDCNVKGFYDVPSCGVPAIIEENFLADVLTVTRVNMDVGMPFFEFTYGNGKFSIRNNQCGCQGDHENFLAIQDCKCAFPQNGTLP